MKFDARKVVSASATPSRSTQLNGNPNVIQSLGTPHYDCS
ncbi:hypothetical protein Pla22_20350 [Rubripirellula amarantea]|uniref:Uncharacterized protein n=1 Tax=Rubripirellula amarantea TaxID=2527999 RepID=A0A5C5WUV4_9BACT|nr:hypothetical protein Pla22_20350 [Rubripirellula amarantea]